MNKPDYINNTINKVKKAPRSYQIFGIISFIIVVLIIIYLIWYIITDYRNTRTNEPWLIKTTKIARTSKVIPGQLIPRSVDEQFGIEFSYTMWIYITDWGTYKSGEYKHILHKGDATAMPLQAPGFWLYPDSNRIAINMNTFESVNESCDIGNIPIGKWFHITLVVIGKNMDVYINGRLKRRCKLKGLPKQNYGNVYITQWNGFDGFLSKVRYFNYALPFWKIEQIVADGPSQAPCVDTQQKPPYFAPDYWFQTGWPNAVGFPK